MWELRWVLLGLGCLLIAGIYFWSKFSGIRRGQNHSAVTGPGTERRRAEPTISQDGMAEGGAQAAVSIEPQLDPVTEVPTDTLESEPGLPDALKSDDSATDSAGVTVEVEPELAARESLSADAPDRVIALRLVARNDALNTQAAILALRELGLQHGRYGIFHRIPAGENESAGFSVANLTEPGSFELASAADSTLPGMTFFLVLPGVGDPVARFDDMVNTARALAQTLEAELLDDRGSSWSIQRERYIREEIILYRHQHGFGALRS